VCVSILEPRSFQKQSEYRISEERIYFRALCVCVCVCVCGSMDDVREVWLGNVQVMLHVWSLSITRTRHHFSGGENDA
jgi:hypothetical protein